MKSRRIEFHDGPVEAARPPAEIAEMVRIEGQVQTPRDFDFADLASLPGQIADVATLVPGREGGAVALRSLLDAVGAPATATRVTLESADGKFSQQAPLAALHSAVLVYRVGDRPLPGDKGGPVRFLIPNVEECNIGSVDRCTNVKALARVRVE